MGDPVFLFVVAAMSGLGGTLVGLGIVLTVRQILRLARNGWRSRW